MSVTECSRWPKWSLEDQIIATQQWALARIDRPLETGAVIWNDMVKKYLPNHNKDNFTSQKAADCAAAYHSIINDNKPKVVEKEVIKEVIVERPVPAQVTVDVILDNIQTLPTSALSSELGRRQGELLEMQLFQAKRSQNHLGAEWATVMQSKIEKQTPLLNIDVVGVLPQHCTDLTKKYGDKVNFKFIPTDKPRIGIRESTDYVIATRGRGHRHDDQIMMALRGDKARLVDLACKGGSWLNVVDDAVAELLARQPAK